MESQRQNLEFIAIEGVIGVGKTSLTRMLADRFNGRGIYEIVEENPFLADFYRDPERYAFQVQMFFLLSRYRQQMEIPQRDLFHQMLIADYIFAKDKIFAYLNLEDRELFLYEKIVSLMERDIPQPDLVIYLKSTPERLMQNIKKRDRPFEREMKYEYIDSLNQAYNQFFNHYADTRLLVVDATEMDFVANREDFETIVNLILNMKGQHAGFIG
ncbi:deoxynucleoside kinase [candidate division KSB1 bacterium 4484_87]|nr:MAG: deoxynucleoside kinase [candidate division KSB1 bacterium 4484_87]